jgi:predicted transcriptional regulator of viral defense system
MKIDDIVHLARTQGTLRAAALKGTGASRTLLPYLVHRGVLRRVARGTYMLADRIPERPGYIEVAAAVPRGVLCLLSALHYHEVTTQMPGEAWVAIQRGARAPAAARGWLRVVQLSGQMFSAGIEEHAADGVAIRVYCVAKTVVDCFRFRNRIGLDVAREALVDALEQRKATRDEIWRFARICRMSRVMRPYLEMAR